MLVESGERRRSIAGEVAPQAPRIGSRNAGRLDVGGTRRAIVEIVDEAREAEARIRVELAGRGHEEIIALVLRAIERRNHRGRGHEQAALVVAATNSSEERRVGQECVSTSRSRCSPDY